MGKPAIVILFVARLKLISKHTERSIILLVIWIFSCFIGIYSVWQCWWQWLLLSQSCWGSINFQKAFWPKLKKLLEGGCLGNAASVAPNILPLMACVPMETAGGSTIFLPKVLEAFKQGWVWNQGVHICIPYFFTYQQRLINWCSFYAYKTSRYEI